MESGKIFALATALFIVISAPSGETKNPCAVCVCSEAIIDCQGRVLEGFYIESHDVSDGLTVDISNSFGVRINFLLCQEESRVNLIVGKNDCKRFNTTFRRCSTVNVSFYVNFNINFGRNRRANRNTLFFGWESKDDSS